MGPTSMQVGPLLCVPAKLTVHLRWFCAALMLVTYPYGVHANNLGPFQQRIGWHGPTLAIPKGESRCTAKSNVCGKPQSAWLYF